MTAKDPHYMRDYMRRRRAAQVREVVKRECETCRQMFAPARSDARFCGDACRARARRNRVIVNLPVPTPVVVAPEPVAVPAPVAASTPKAKRDRVSVKPLVWTKVKDTITPSKMMWEAHGKGGRYRILDRLVAPLWYSKRERAAHESWWYLTLDTGRTTGELFGGFPVADTRDAKFKQLASAKRAAQRWEDEA